MVALAAKLRASFQSSGSDITNVITGNSSAFILCHDCHATNQRALSVSKGVNMDSGHFLDPSA